MPLDKAPFNGSGNLLGFAGHGSYVHEWRDNQPFSATMTFTDLSRGRSSIKFYLEDEHGHRYEMFAKDLLDLVRTSSVDEGKVTGDWIIIKRGRNYGVKLVSS
jgi:hypothetical protein